MQRRLTEPRPTGTRLFLWCPLGFLSDWAPIAVQAHTLGLYLVQRCNREQRYWDSLDSEGSTHFSSSTMCNFPFFQNKLFILCMFTPRIYIYTTKIDGVVCPPNISETVAGRLMKLANRQRIASTTIKLIFFKNDCPF